MNILSIGQCNFDHKNISKFLESSLDCTVVRANNEMEALDSLKGDEFELILVNRKLDLDQADGIGIIERFKNNDSIKEIPIMLISNYPEYQEKAMEKGAVRGFGKSEIGKSEILDHIKTVVSK